MISTGQWQIRNNFETHNNDQVSIFIVSFRKRQVPPLPPPYNILKPASWLVRQQVGLDSSDGWMDAGFSSTRSIDQLGRLGGKGCCMWGWRRWSEEREWRWLRWEGNGGVEGYEGDINAVRGLHILNRVRTRRRWERMSHTRIEIGW